MKSSKELRETLQRWAGQLGFPANEKTLYVLPLPGLLCGAVVQHQKFLVHEAVELQNMTQPASIAQALHQLAEKGMGQKSLVLLVNQPSCRFLPKKFPDMTEEELEETFYWEEDRIFHADDPMALGHRVLSHSPEGYETILAAWPRKEMEIWQEGAALAGRKLEEAYPVLDISLGKGPFFALYAKKDSGTLLFRKQKEIWTKRVTLAEEGAFFMHSMMEQQKETDLPCFVIPMADCKEEKWLAWKVWLDGEMQQVNEGLEIEETEDTWEEEPVEEEPTEENYRLHWADGQGGLSTESLWDGITPLFIYGESCQVRLPLFHERETPIFSPENRTLRLAQGALLLAFLFCIFSVGRYVDYAWQQNALQKEAESWRPIKEQWMAQKQEEKREEDLLNFLKQLEQEDPHWEQKLVLLSDSMPQGVVLSQIKTEGKRVQILGTAQSAAALHSLEQQLKLHWGGDLRVAKRRNNPVTKLVEFTLEWKAGS